MTSSLRDRVFAAPPPAVERPLRALQMADGARRVGGAVLKALGLVGLTALVLGFAALMVDAHPWAESRSAGAQGTGWIAVRRPFQFYTLVGTDFAKLPAAHTALRHAEGGGRIDLLTFGEPRDNGPYVALSLYRVGKEAKTVSEFSTELEQTAVVAGSWVASSRRPTVLTTRFGAFEAADLRLVAGGVETPCLGFRSGPDDAQILRISGFACGVADKPIGRDALACVIDRLDLVAAGEDTELQKVFVEAERKRGSACSLPSLTAAGTKNIWLDANNSPPPLKRLER